MERLNSKEELISFIKSVVALVLPMAIQNLINVGVQAADVVMLGKVGEIAISASSLAGQVYFIMTLIFFGLTSGAAVLTAQYWGKRDITTIEKILGLALRTALIVSAIFTILALAIPNYLMRIFSNDADVIKYGAQYLRIIAVAYIPAGFTMVYLNTIRSVEKVIISTVVYSVSLVVNIILNAILIFGLFGFPAMGIRGAAIATAVSRYVEFIIVIVYALKMNDVLKIRLMNLLHTDKLLIKDFTQFALPVTLNELMWGGGISAINAIIGHLGSSAVAANSVVGVVRQLVMVITFGVANATAIMLGKKIGEGKELVAKIYAKRFIILTLILGVLGSLVILMLTPVIPSFMTLGTESEKYLTQMMLVMAYFVIASGFNTVAIVGVFRAGGDTKIGLILDCVTLWGVAVLFGFIAAFVLKLPVIYVYLILTSDEITKIVFVIKRYKSYKWLQNVTREF